MILILTNSDNFVFRVLLTIKLDKTFCLVSVPGPVQPAAVLKVIEYFRGGGKAPIWTTQWLMLLLMITGSN